MSGSRRSCGAATRSASGLRSAAADETTGGRRCRRADSRESGARSGGADDLRAVSRLRDRADARRQDACAARHDRTGDQAGRRIARPGPARVRHPADDEIVEASIDDTRFTMLVLSGFARGRVAARRRRSLRHARLSHLAAHAGVRRAPRARRVDRQCDAARRARGRRPDGRRASRSDSPAPSASRARFAGCCMASRRSMASTIAGVVVLVAVGGDRRRQPAGLARRPRRSGDRAARRLDPRVRRDFNTAQANKPRQRRYNQRRNKSTHLRTMSPWPLSAPNIDQLSRHTERQDPDR